MTKKQIEEKLHQEMYQNIPDKNALWQKIENRLPEQPVSQPVRRSISITPGRKFLTAAACFLLILAGLRNLHSQRNLKEETAAPADHASYAENAVPEQAAEENAAPPAVRSEANTMLKYQNLNLSHEKTIASGVNLSRLGTEDEYFSEEEILTRTQFFLDVRVISGSQNPDSGNMNYILEILAVYGGELNQQQIALETCSAYLLEQNHEYVLPVTADLALAYECAPQIEKTLDHQLVIPNGWHTLMQSDAVPVLYDSYGTDDYFYDRMYLTKDLNLDLLIRKWQSL